MKLFDTPMAPNPRRVRWVMAEKAIDDVEIVTLNIMQGDHKQAAYLDKSGLPTVPLLELDDGTCIAESLAICRYLEAVYPEPNLFGRDAQETAVIEMWTRRAELMVANPLMQGVRHTHPALAVLENQNPAFADYSRESGLKALEMLDERLAGQEWIAAGRFTIADIIAFIGIDFGRLIKLKPPERLTNVGRWAQAMRERPAAQIAR